MEDLGRIHEPRKELGVVIPSFFHDRRSLGHPLSSSRIELSLAL